MPAKAQVKWNDKHRHYCVWVQFDNGKRQHVFDDDLEKCRQAHADALDLKAQGGSPDPRVNKITWQEIVDLWIADGAPALGDHTRTINPKGQRSSNEALKLLRLYVLTHIGNRVVRGTKRAEVAVLFENMAKTGLAHSTIMKCYGHLLSATRYAVYKEKLKKNPSEGILLQKGVAAQERKSLTLRQAQHLLENVCPVVTYGVMWMVGVMCGLRPGELCGLRWKYLDIDSEIPFVMVEERAAEDENHKYIGQAPPKPGANGRSSKRALKLHPLLVAALRKHREEQAMLDQYDPEGFVFLNRRGNRMTLDNTRNAIRSDFAKAFGGDWTTYELRHTFGTRQKYALEDLERVADSMGNTPKVAAKHYIHDEQELIETAADSWDHILSTAKAEAIVMKEDLENE